jgi:selenide, water dikinase
VPDDAGVVRVAPDLAMILTVDFFTPVVDDPVDYGRIAAANSLSDVYAMGGEPFAALNVLAFPAASPELPLEIMGEILRGGGEKAIEAGVAIVGGHTVDDPEPKYGLSVIGRVHPDAVVRKGGAVPGDLLVLTKPIGTGILTTALKQQRLTEAELAPAVEVMATLNAGAMRAMRHAGGPHAATDVTGYGLLGHLSEMLRASSAGARLSVGAVPMLDGARELASAGVAPGGSHKNLAATASLCRWEGDIADADRMILADAQTSGGLLIAIPAAASEALLERLAAENTPACAVIGEITAEPGIVIEP